jgi:hypothetical protein
MGAAAALAMFVGSYSTSLLPLRRLSRQLASGYRAPARKSVASLADLWMDVGPSIMIHGQALAVAVVASGMAKGAVDGYLSGQRNQSQGGEQRCG